MDKEQKHRLISVLVEQMYRVEDLCSSDDLSPDIIVHEIRKSFKRINALLRLFPELLQEEVEAFRQPMKELARRLTLPRETTVNLQFFEKMCIENDELSLPEAQDLHQQLAIENQLSLQALFEGESVFDAIKTQMQTGRYSFLETLPDNDYEIDIAAELELAFQTVHELFLVSVTEYQPEEYHELRKKMKILRYQFEFIHPGQMDVPGTLSEKLHNITNRLGDDHDWYVFLKKIEEDKYTVSVFFKSLVEETIQHYQKENLLTLNQSLALFFREDNNEFRKAIRKI